VWDFGDEPAGAADGYGSMQVHNHDAKQTLFAINHWKEGSRADVGIGNQSKDNPDWTFAANAGSYKAKRLRVLVRSVAPGFLHGPVLNLEHPLVGIVARRLLWLVEDRKQDRRVDLLWRDGPRTPSCSARCCTLVPRPPVGRATMRALKQPYRRPSPSGGRRVVVQ